MNSRARLQEILRSILAAARAAALLLLAVAAAEATGATFAGPGAGSAAMGGGSHGWVAMPGDGWVSKSIRHLPPRAGAGVLPGAPDGTVLALPTTLAVLPEAMAAWGNRVYLIFEPEWAAGELSRPVLSVAAEKLDIAGTDEWLYRLAAGRLEQMPSLVLEGDLLDVAGTAGGVLALLRTRGPAPGGDGGNVRSMILDGAGWRELPLPRDWSERLQGNGARGVNEVGGAAVRVVAREEGMWLVAAGFPGSGAWRGDFTSEPTEAFDSPSGGEAEGESDAESTESTRIVRTGVDWAWTPMPWRRTEGGDLPAPTGPLMDVGGRLTFFAEEERGVMAFWQRTRAGWERLGAVGGVGNPCWIVPMDSAARVALLWNDAAPGSSSLPGGSGSLPRLTMITEVSSDTGRVMYRGPALARSPITVRDFKVLAVLLLAVMVSVLLFVVRPESHVTPVALPEGLAMAAPGRRVLAGVFDLIPALVIAGNATGVGAGEALAVWGLPFRENGAAVLGLALVIAVLHCTICEWLWGASLGKAISGCRVVAAVLVKDPADGSLVPGVGKLRLWQALVRNALRWLVPPVGLEGVLAQDRRHRGDMIARTAVVMFVAPEEEQPGE